MSTLFHGKAWIFGNHVDTDIIIPSRFLTTDNEIELGKHAFADTLPDFHKTLARGDILVAGRNFGCGSSREHALLAIRGAGISCIIADSYARTFFRNCINRGFYAIELRGASQYIEQGDTVDVNIDKGIIMNHTKNTQYMFVPFPDFIREICMQNGLLNFIQNQLTIRAREKNEKCQRL